MGALTFPHHPRRGVGASLPVLLLVVIVGCSTGSPSAVTGDAPTEPAPTRTESPAEPSTRQNPRPDALPAYSATVRRIGPELRERMRFTHRRGCPVRLRDLRYLRLSFVGFGGTPRTGEMVIRRSHAKAVVGVFRRLYEDRWRIRRMRLVDDYRGSDARSMSANNTSGYNCRLTGSGDRFSEHAYGRAIDINPIQNPYVVGSTVQPKEGRRYARIDRSADARARRGVIISGDVVVSAFARIGWEWGGDWVYSDDYQHFSSTGQ